MTGKRSKVPRPRTDAAASAEITRLSKRFGESAVSLRRRSDRSQAVVAQRAGLHATEISLLERGLRTPRLGTIVQLAAGIDAEPCDLLAGMAWRIDFSRRPGASDLPPPGCFEIEIGEQWVRV